MKNIIFLLLLPLTVFCQKKEEQGILKGANTIIVKNISFTSIVNALLDKGYTIEKIDSNYKTVQTAWSKVPLKNGKPSFINLSMYIRVNDTAAIFTGKFYSDVAVGTSVSLSDINPIYIFTSSYGGGGIVSGTAKLTFMEMKTFAESLSDQIECAKK